MVAKTKGEIAKNQQKINQLCKSLKVKKKVVTFDPEDIEKKKNWKDIHDLDKNNVDIVITWAVGARSINYWQKCLVISLFIFDLKEELRQCGGRSNRNFPRDKLIQIRVVVNAETVKRQKDDQEAAKKMEEGKEGVRFGLMHSG